MTGLTAALDALVAAHRAMGSPIGDFLRPGLPAAAVARELDALGLPAPPDVVELYGWADGTDEGAWQAQAGQAPFLRFLGDTTFASLVDAAGWCRTARGLAEAASFDSPEGLAPEAFWDPSWIPAFRLDRGEIAVACSRSEPPSVHEVVWDAPAPGTGRSYPDLTTFILDATRRLRDDFVWLPNDRVLLHRDVAALGT